MIDERPTAKPQPFAFALIQLEKYPWIAPVMALLGIILFWTAHTISTFIHVSIETARELNIGLWLLALGNVVMAYVKPHYSKETTRRVILVFILFALGFFSPRHDYLDFNAGTLAMLGILLLTAGLVLWRSAHPVLAKIARYTAKTSAIPPAIFATLGYLLFLSFALLVSWRCFTLIPGYDDATAQYVQAKFIASGHLYGRTPIMPQFFPVSMMVNDGKWYAQYQPLHVFMIGFGHFIGAPWIINPLSGSLTVFLIYLITRRIFGEATGRIAVLLSLFCTFMLIMSAEFMNHTTALLFTTLMIYCYIETLESLKINLRNCYSWSFATGLAGGAVFLTRPLTAVGVALPFAIHGIILLRRNLHYYLKPYALMALGGLLCVGYDLWYNQELTGGMLMFPTGKYHGANNLSAMGYSEHFSLSYVFSKAEHEWARLNRQLFEWWLPSTFFLMLYCLLPVRSLYARLLLGVIISHTLVNLGNQFNSTVFGPRYLYEISSAVIILSAAGIARIPLLLRTLGIRLRGVAISNGIVCIIIMLILVFSLWERIPATINLYSRNFFDHHPDFYDDMMSRVEEPSLIFVGRAGNAQNKYKWVRFTNPPDDDALVIFAMDRGNDKDKDLAERYMERRAFIEFQDRLIPLDDAISGKVPNIPDLIQH